MGFFNSSKIIMNVYLNIFCICQYRDALIGVLTFWNTYWVDFSSSRCNQIKSKKIMVAKRFELLHLTIPEYSHS